VNNVYLEDGGDEKIILNCILGKWVVRMGYIWNWGSASNVSWIIAFSLHCVLEIKKG
jgi:hypothetical protein